MMILAIGLTIVALFALPLFLRGLVAKVLPGTLWRNLFEGFIRAVILVHLYYDNFLTLRYPTGLCLSWRRA